MPSFDRSPGRLLRSFGLLLASALPLAPAAAQSVTSAAIVGSVRDSRGSPIRDVLVTLERDGVAFRILSTDFTGRFSLPAVAPGRYAVLAEQVGYAPVRITGVPLIAGQMRSLTIELPQRPPPITTVIERPFSGRAALGVVEGEALDRFDRRRDVTDVTRDLSMADAPLDGRRGFVASANGTAPAQSRLMVDGLEESLLRHPGVPNEPATAPLYARDGVSQAEYLAFGLDSELRGTPGALLNTQGARGGERFTFLPFVTYSGASLGGAAADNPADSSATSLQAGVAMGGPIKGDTASWFVRFGYQQLQQPTAEPFALGGRELASAIAAADAAASEAALSPPVRSWTGATGSGRIDWRFGDWSSFMVRFGLANWNEDAPQLDRSLVSGAGSRLEASDISGAAQLTTGADEWTSETRLGIRSSRRDWLGAALPQTTLVADGAAFGSAATLAGEFSESAIEFGETVSYRTGDHRIKVGVQAVSRSVTYDWIPNGAGRADFGDLDHFTAGEGTWLRTTADGDAPDLSVIDAAVFLQDTWRASAGLTITGGVRYALQRLPDDAFTLSEEWGVVSGIPNVLLPETGGVFAPRAGLTWDVDQTGRTVVHLAGGVAPGQHDLAAFSEVARSSTGMTVARAVGALDWPGVAATSEATTLTMYAPGARQPRAITFSGGVTRALGGGASLYLDAGYHHTDYLLRRTDLNQPALSAGTDEDGRTLRGALVQQGGLVTALPGSNRRFAEFDHVYALGSTGFVDHYRATVGISRPLTRGLSLDAAYTWSQTEDNLVGQLETDPADRLSPFASTPDDAAWDEGRSDLDIPHRVAVTARYRTAGATPIAVAARWRFRSGLPFTAGFRRGVDANGDGGTGNDPVGLGSVAGLAAHLREAGCDDGTNGFAARNGCREDAVQALDLHASVGLAVGGGRRLHLTLDAFNLASSATGIVDRAAVLVDPAGAITINDDGQVVLPLVLNDNFGGLLARRGDPRTIRLGLRLEH